MKKLTDKEKTDIKSQGGLKEMLRKSRDFINRNEKNAGKRKKPLDPHPLDTLCSYTILPV